MFMIYCCKMLFIIFIIFTAYTFKKTSVFNGLAVSSNGSAIIIKSNGKSFAPEKTHKNYMKKKFGVTF